MKIRLISLGLILGITSFSNLFGQSTDNKIFNDPLGWFQSKGFEVRNSFDGTKNESKPAFINYAKDFAADTNSNMTIDIAIKYNPSVLGKDDSFFVLYPALEWHRKVVNQDLRDPNSYNKFSGAVKNEIKFFENTKPVLVNSFTISNDFKDDELEMSFTTESTVFFPNTEDGINGLFLSNDERSIRVFPYIGFEQFWGMNEAFDNLSFFKTRTHIKIVPFPYELLVLDINYTLRSQLTSNNLVQSPRIFSITAAFKVSNYFSVNVDYDYGEEPKSEFVELNALLLGLGLKL